MKTTLLGSNGRLGGMLKRHAGRIGLDWSFQQRNGTAGLIWSGDFSDPAADVIFGPGDTIINMIGDTGQNPDHLTATNLHFVRTLLTRARDSGVAHVLLASSAAVYGKGDGTPLVETAPLRPLSPYGASKAAMEEAAHSMTDGPAITILRIGNVAGADALLSAAHQRTSLGEPMSLHRFAEGRAAQRSYIGPQDLAAAITTLAKRPPDGVQTFNIAHPSPVFLDDLLEAYKAHLLPDLTWEDAPAPDGIPPAVVLDTTALNAVYPFASTPNPSDLFARQVAKDSLP